MSKMANRSPTKVDQKGSGSGDHRRDSGRGDKSQNNRMDSSYRGSKQDTGNNRPETQNEDTEKGGESKGEKKFTGRCRLFVGNLTPDVTENEFKKMFEPYGEVSEVFVNASRGFGFIRLDYRQNAEAAKAALDGLQRKGRILRVRFATHGAALRVKNLHQFVSNELLEQAFSQFGELERAIVIVDDRGKPTGEGLVEFVRKPGAQQALRRINEGVFLIGTNPKPIEVEPLEHKDEEDGMPEKFLPRNEQYKKEREKDPRFAPPGSFEYDFGMRWKQLAEMERKGIEQVKKEMDENRLKLEDDMQNAIYEYQAEQIRQDLLRQQEELRRLEELRNQDRMRRAQEMEMRRQEQERALAQEERRRQEMMMRQQEMARRGGGGPGGPNDMPMRGGRDEMMGSMRGEGPGFQGGMGMRGGDAEMALRGGAGGAGGASAEAGMRGGRGGAPPMQPPPAPPASLGMERGGPAGQPGMARMAGGGGASGGAGGFGGQPGMGGGSGGAGAANAGPGPGFGGSPNVNNMGPGGMGGPGGPAQMERDAEDRTGGTSSVPPSSCDDGVWLKPSQLPDPSASQRPMQDGNHNGTPQSTSSHSTSSTSSSVASSSQGGSILPQQQQQQPSPQSVAAQRMLAARMVQAAQRTVMNQSLRQRYMTSPFAAVPAFVRLRRVPGPPVRVRMRWSKQMASEGSTVDRA